MVPDAVYKLWSFVSSIMNNARVNKGQGGDGRERQLLKHVMENAEKNPQSVLKIIDKFGSRLWLMNIGDDKGVLLDNAIIDQKPRVVLELGAYVGYSAVRIASQLEEGSKLISLEMVPENARVARGVVDHAGLSHKVTIVDGILKDKVDDIQRMLEEMNAEKLDFVFIDHDKNYYLQDMLILKEKGLVGKGSVLFADNMRIPGSPLYREYVTKTHADEFDTVEHQSNVEYIKWMPDSVMISTIK